VDEEDECYKSISLLSGACATALAMEAAAAAAAAAASKNKGEGEGQGEGEGGAGPDGEGESGAEGEAGAGSNLSDCSKEERESAFTPGGEALLKAFAAAASTAVAASGSD
jgi:hypothetical protein